MEAPAAPEHDGRREHEREPLPAVELQWRDHCERRQRRREHSGDDQPQAKLTSGVLGLGSIRFKAGPVAGRLDRAHQVLERGAGRVEADRGLLGREVDRGFDAFELVELPLDARSARSAGHSLQLEPHTLGRLDDGRHQAATAS